MDNDLASRIRQRLQEALPGEQVQYRMAPHYRKRGSFKEINPSEYRHSAVILLLCRRRQGSWFIPLTLRSEYAGAHSAQVSLPGGKQDHDEPLATTALRECDEEIGISGQVDILGQLTSLHIPVSRFIVHPFVAINQQQDFVFRSHEREVQAIIEAPLKVLFEDTNVLSGEVMVAPGQKLQAPYFFIDGHKVWGATAMILNELKHVLKGMV